MTALSFVFAFVLMLGILIFVHELGHFLMAKAFGVRVLKFSLGFGNPIGFGRWRMRFERNGTEYVAAWFPLGGFVKMLGENPDEEQGPEALANPGETLGAKPLWQRLLIFFAGPGMNLLLPVLLFAAHLMVGVSRPAAVVGTVEPGSPAAQVGIAPGDRVLAVAGEPVRWWSEVEERITDRPGQPLDVTVESGGERREVVLPVLERSDVDELGARSSVGWAGIAHSRPRAMLGVPDTDSPAAAAGLHSGDRVVSVGGSEVADWNELVAAYGAAARGGPTVWTIERGAPDAPERMTVTVSPAPDLAALGVVPAGALISEVSPDSPAARAGLARGDLIVAVEGRPLTSFAELVRVVTSSEGNPIRITYARDGITQTISLRPELRETENELGLMQERYLIGIQAPISVLQGALAKDVERNPLAALGRGAAMTADATARIIEGIWLLITGEVSRKAIAGPIGIAMVAHNALQLGFEIYLQTLILISINLGILNLLPIPVLDGGQAMFAIIEAVKRSPLSLRTKELYQSVGITALLFLMGFAFWNDISRYWGRFLDYLRNSVGL